MTPTLTIAIPTIGRDSLRHTLDSITRQQLIDGDRVLVVADSFQHGYRYDLKELVEGYGWEFQYHEFDGGRHFMGNPQLNHAISLAQTDFFCALGDDDVFVDGAIYRLRSHLEPGRATLYQFYSPPFDTRDGSFRFVLWDEPKLQVAHISGCCIAAPVSCLVPVSDEERIEVDFDWIVNIVKQTGKKPHWLRDCLIIARPDLRHGEPVHRGVTTCRGCGLVAYLEDLDISRFCAECEGTVLREHFGASQ
jgi:glycosyltransferase involved in cell wall biosynthesis